MRTKHIPASWLKKEGLRLDCGPYMSGALEAKVTLEALSAKKMLLKDVTVGGENGIVNAGRFKRLWVNDADYGVPFLSSSSILQADLSNLPFISKKAVKESPQLTIRKGQTLITRSGTIGRMAYTRPDMDGLACSEHVMRVIPDESKIPSGYLYAYLSSKFGVPLVVSGTYGAIIQHIEPHHIADLPVPRLGDKVEKKVHELMEEAARSRSDAAGLRNNAIRNMENEFGLSDLSHAATSISHCAFNISSKNIRRLDAAHFHPTCVNAAHELANCLPTTETLSSVSRVFTPGIFKRQHVDNPQFGYAYYSGSELFQYGPAPRGHLSKKAPKIGDYIVEENWLLIQDAGQLGGLVGHLVRVNSCIGGGVVSNHLMRIVPKNESDSAYLFVVLSSPHGYRAITRQAFGTSIPQLDPKHISEIKVPWPNRQLRQKIAAPIQSSWKLEDRALVAEKEAITLVEQAIEEAS